MKNKVLDTIQANPLAVAALAYGLYSGLGRLKNLREQQGCPKCESLQMAVAFGLAAWAGWELWQSYQA
jgi:hypothetical protein